MWLMRGDFASMMCSHIRFGRYTMEKTALADTFRERLAALVADHPRGRTGFARDVGIDRSALAQFLGRGATRLPRAETLRAIAETRGVSVDWLLGLANATEGGQ